MQESNQNVRNKSHIKARKKAENARTLLIPLAVAPPPPPPLPVGLEPDSVLVLLGSDEEEDEGAGRSIVAVFAASWKEVAV